MSTNSQAVSSTVAVQQTQSRVVARDGEFTKFDVIAPELEFEKARALWELGTQIGFRVPEVLRFDCEARSVTWAYIPGLESLRVPYIEHMTAGVPRTECLDLIGRAGSVLAQIHRGLHLRQVVDWAASPDFEAAFVATAGAPSATLLGAVPWAVAHCDFGFSNVNYARGMEDDRLIVLDATANGHLTFASNLRAPIYIDVANFVVCLEGLVPPWVQLRMRWARLPEVREAFLEGYESSSGIRLNRELLVYTAYAAACCYVRWRYRSSLVASAALIALFNRFKGNVPGKRA